MICVTGAVTHGRHGTKNMTSCRHAPLEKNHFRFRFSCSILAAESKTSGFCDDVYNDVVSRARPSQGPNLPATEPGVKSSQRQIVPRPSQESTLPATEPPVKASRARFQTILQYPHLPFTYKFKMLDKTSEWIHCFVGEPM